MSARNTEEHCPCGHRLRTAIEQDTGLCWACQLRGEGFDPYEGHEHCDPERAAAKIDAARGDWEAFEWAKEANHG